MHQNTQTCRHVGKRIRHRTTTTVARGGTAGKSSYVHVGASSNGDVATGGAAAGADAARLPGAHAVAPAGSRGGRDGKDDEDEDDEDKGKDGEKTWAEASVLAFAARSGRYRLLYDHGDEIWTKLKESDVEVIGETEPGEAGADETGSGGAQAVAAVGKRLRVYYGTSCHVHIYCLKYHMCSSPLVEQEREREREKGGDRTAAVAATAAAAAAAAAAVHHHHQPEVPLHT